MAGFKFERNLEHQETAVESVMGVFHDVHARPNKDLTMVNVTNPDVRIGGAHYQENLMRVQNRNNIDTQKYRNKTKVLDISMETGTGKTYTYTKMMFELNKQLKVSKFIVVVPTLSIKAGTVNFLKAKATKEHFRQEYATELKSYVVESKKAKKSKKSTMPQAVREFVEANHFAGTSIHVLIINAGMINSETMKKAFHVSLFDKHNTPFSAIASTMPITIVDEPHKFAKGKVTWENIQHFGSQYIVRYGATFNGEFENLLYRLSAVDAFNQDLVKGIVAHVQEFDGGKNVLVTLKSSDANAAHFELNTNGNISKHQVAKKESMGKIHEEMESLYVVAMNKSVVQLSNGLELRRNTSLNPYSYAQSLQDKMMEETIKRHFELERELMRREKRIKPLSLFFIDDIEGYRDGANISGSLKSKFETLVKAYLEKTLKDETNTLYRDYLEKSLLDISLIHGGYFSKDNSDKDDKIEKEIEEILHDKEALLSVDNPRRFIFSKWTLREGWDNPNVFQICKLRSSGSSTSKLQEVGRGLRLPVNEHMARVKEEDFKLHYYVDFTEKAFVDELVAEINDKSGTINALEVPKRLSSVIIAKILEVYEGKLFEDEVALLEILDVAGSVKRNNDFKEGGFEILKTLYPEAFSDGLKGGKVSKSTDKKPQVTLRDAKYKELQTLWESINQKVILEYKVDKEENFYALLKKYFLDNKEKFKPLGVVSKTNEVKFENNVAYYKEYEAHTDEMLPVVTMTYKAFVLELSTKIHINMMTLHKVFVDIKEHIDINLYKNMQTIRSIRAGFNSFLLSHAMSEFTVGYNNVRNEVHPTAFTNKDGVLHKTIDAHNVGVHHDSKEKVGDVYFFDEFYYDSQLEKQNIKENFLEGVVSVVVFTKIPKNSIKIPVAGGGTYSPDFAYVLKDSKSKETLHLVVETKNKTEENLATNEKQKIAHAQMLFASMDNSIEVKFETQLTGMKMKNILEKVMQK